MQAIEQRKKLKHDRESVVVGGGGGSDMPMADGAFACPSSGDEDGVSVFPVEEIVRYPQPGNAAPVAFAFSPDDAMVAFLYSPEGSLNRKVFGFDTVTGKREVIFSPPDGGLDESNLSPEERLRRERLRERGLGVTKYEWVKSCSKKAKIMVPLPAGVYLQEVAGLKPELKLPCNASMPIIDPHLSPDGTMLAYVMDDELLVRSLLHGESKVVTPGAKRNSKIYGLAEYIAQEEMDRKGGFWWSLDCKYIAFTEVDESDVPLFRIMHQGKSSVGPDAEEDHAYPFAGASNVKVRLGVVCIHTGNITWMDLLCGINEDEEYLARVNWMPGNILTSQVLNRRHTRLKILKFDITSGQREILLVEENNVWINLHDCFTPLDKVAGNCPGGFIWASEKTGFRHLYLHDRNGNCLAPITEGEWMVEQIAGVNENAGLVYFVGTMDGPLETNLYCTKLFPDWSGPLEVPRRLTSEKGRHVVVLDNRLQRFVDIYDSLGSPPRVWLSSLHDGNLIMPLYEQSLSTSQLKNLPLLPPEIFKISATDATPLYGALYKPDPEKFGPPPYKTLINVYGGPGLQFVYDSWVNTVDMRAQYLRSKGILVCKLDNRGSARRGLNFEGALKHKFGLVDSEDQVAGVEWLIRTGLAKPGHVGIYGWSYGGFLSAICLSRYPDLFQCAVSGAPVTAWDGYDTFYTEKYMGLPTEHSDQYEISSVMHHVTKIKGYLLLVHGMIDENVHFRHTARLVNALVAAGKPYELLVFPDERHMPRRRTDRIYMEKRIWDFVERNL